MSVEETLLDTLNTLLQKDFETFKWFLPMQILAGYEQIAKSDLETATRPQTVSLMVCNYGEDAAVDVAVLILKKMRNRNAAEKLEKKFKEFKTGAAPAAPAAPAAAPAAITAHQSSVIAPNLSGCTVQTLNITMKQ